MYLNLKCIILIILSYQCLTICAFKSDNIDAFLNPDYNPLGDENCIIPFPASDTHFMPIPYQPNITGPAVITPDKDGNLFIGNDDYFQLACTGGSFLSPTKCKGQTEITVQCKKNNWISFNNRTYKFDKFRCSTVPKSKFKADNVTCNGADNKVFSVGFETKVPLTLYRVCLDVGHQRPLYSWRYLNTPVYKHIQSTKLVPKFIDTENFNVTDVIRHYNNQERTVETNINKFTIPVDKFIVKSIGLFIIPYQLLTKSQFVYSFQQHATYYYENTAPLWSVFGRGVWRDLERLILRNMLNTNGKYLMATGTYNQTFLIKSTINPLLPLAINYPHKMPVPLFTWILTYEVSTKKGTVYIGLNYPFQDASINVQFCDVIPCPIRYGKKAAASLKSIYCCSQESFEKVYGIIDPIVFEEF